MYPIILTDRLNPQQPMDLSLRQKNGSGLTNQLFSLVNGVLRNNIPNRTRRGDITSFTSVFIVDAFNTCIESGRFCEPSKIINMKETSHNFSQIFGRKIFLFDRHKLPDIRIFSGSYGSPQPAKRINLSQDIINTLNYMHFYNQSNNDDRLEVKFTNDFIGADPFPGFRKSVYLKIKIDDTILDIEYNENHIFSSLFDFSDAKSDFDFYDTLDVDLFNRLLINIVFAPEFYHIVSLIKGDSSFSMKKLVFVYFRMEDDAIKHWSKQNRMNEDEFQSKLITLYKSALEQTVDNNNQIVVLSQNPDNMIQSFPTYKYIRGIGQKESLLIEKLGMSGRELSAIVDLILAKDLCGTFIGCHNLELKRGSTFSYNIIQNIKPGNKMYLIDLDDVNLPLQIYVKQ